MHISNHPSEMNLSAQMFYCQQQQDKDVCCHLFYKTADPENESESKINFCKNNIAMSCSNL